MVIWERQRIISWHFWNCTGFALVMVLFDHRGWTLWEQARPVEPAQTWVHILAPSPTYSVTLGQFFMCNMKMLIKPTSQGQCLLKENPISASFCTFLSYSLKGRPRDKLYSSMSQKKRVQGSGQAKCNAMCCVVHGWPWSEQKWSLGKDYFMMNLVVDSQSDQISLVKTAHYEIGRNTARDAFWILGQSLWILKVSEAPTEMELNLVGDDASPIWPAVLDPICGMVRDKRHNLKVRWGNWDP